MQRQTQNCDDKPKDAMTDPKVQKKPRWNDKPAADENRKFNGKM
jgi:hypothetical protein